MAAPEPEVQEFIKRLTLGTRNGQVKWAAEADGWFHVEAEGLTVVIRTESEEDQQHPNTFLIKNDKGMTLVTVSSLSGEYYADWEDDLEALFKAARSQALGLDAGLRGLTDKLGLPSLSQEGTPGDEIPFEVRHEHPSSSRCHAIDSPAGMSFIEMKDGNLFAVHETVDQVRPSSKPQSSSQCSPAPMERQRRSTRRLSWTCESRTRSRGLCIRGGVERLSALPLYRSDS